jgi:site-specific DNA-adenine methylase
MCEFCVTKNNVMKEFTTAPLPFVGQKRMFAKEFKKVLKQFDDATVFVDLFGGSGLLSHITKREKPHVKVIYNDYDNYRQRLDNIPRTNALLSDLRIIVENIPRVKVVSTQVKEAILSRIEIEEQTGFVDYITLSSSLLFSMKYVLNIKELRKEAVYNKIRKTDYSDDGYLEGLTVVCEDYKFLFDQYKDVPGVVFLVDPPYLCTEVGTYNMRWRLADYLDVLRVLCGYSFVYFTSNKSSVLELCRWIELNKSVGNPFKEASKVVFNAHMNYNSSYMDMMLYRNDEGNSSANAA